jgi:hypothetical protein
MTKKSAGGIGIGFSLVRGLGLVALPLLVWAAVAVPVLQACGEGDVDITEYFNDAQHSKLVGECVGPNPCGLTVGCTGRITPFSQVLDAFCDCIPPITDTSN